MDLKIETFIIKFLFYCIVIQNDKNLSKYHPMSEDIQGGHLQCLVAN